MDMRRVFVIQKGKAMRDPPLLLGLAGVLFIYLESVWLPVALVAGWLHQAIFFSIFRIPKVRLRDFLVIDRHKLQKINAMQKLGCVYCGCANAIVAWGKEIVNRTEIYSCAIKHSITKRGMDHQEHFYDYQDFR